MFEFLSHNPAFYFSAVALFGLIVGSFLNVVIHRLPAMLQHGWKQQCRELLELEADSESVPGLIAPRSACPQCGAPIRAWHNIPLLSYLLLRGRCHDCKTAISLRYPLVEALTALLAVTVVWQLGATPQALAGIVLTWILIPLAVIDADHQLLPDGITLPGLWLGLLINWFGVLTELSSAVIGAAAGYLVLWLLFHGFKLLTGKEGMGYGDFKLFALLGAWLGWQALPLIILLGACAGAVIGIALIAIRGRDRNVPMPFGPYLCIAGWIALLWGDRITSAYLRSAGLY